MIRNCYTPTGACNSVGDPSKVADNQPAWAGSAVAGNLTADQLVQHYCHWIHQKTGSYEATARKLGIDRRTVKAKIALIK